MTIPVKGQAPQLPPRPIQKKDQTSKKGGHDYSISKDSGEISQAKQFFKNLWNKISGEKAQAEKENLEAAERLEKSIVELKHHVTRIEDDVTYGDLKGAQFESLRKDVKESIGNLRKELEDLDKQGLIVLSAKSSLTGVETRMKALTEQIRKGEDSNVHLPQPVVIPEKPKTPPKLPPDITTKKSIPPANKGAKKPYSDVKAKVDTGLHSQSPGAQASNVPQKKTEDTPAATQETSTTPNVKGIADAYEKRTNPNYSNVKSKVDTGPRSNLKKPQNPSNS